ncbi:response regulator [thermophilic bacterium 2918]|uniref:Response regulator n=2 Tax=Thermogemmata fonticola TaxID=2755323 RepID=A0A7V8VGB3_9BACT|nr:response regulator [Thermogemmata fonticola]
MSRAAGTASPGSAASGNASGAASSGQAGNAASSHPAPASAAGVANRSGQKLILVVDDDREMVDGLRAVLERHGYRVIHAHDGHQGKQAIYLHRPDLVILDMMMPRMGGFPVLEHFRDKKDAPPIIMITANEGSRHKAYAEYLGVVDYIRKPFAMERLVEAVNRVLRGSGGGESGQTPAS